MSKWKVQYEDPVTGEWTDVLKKPENTTWLFDSFADADELRAERAHLVPVPYRVTNA